MTHEWVDELPASITVCSKTGIIVEMNDLATRNRASQGGRELIGKNMLVCHPDDVHERIKTLLSMGEKNVYILESSGSRKLILQSPWYQNGEYQGFVSIAFEIPVEIRVVRRDI